MLEVQKYLHGGKTLSNLTTELGISVYEHPSLPLVGLKYNQIESPKTHPIVRECRGIVLEKNTWKLVARGFYRFFNYGEMQEEMKDFDWSDFTVTCKHDGSLGIVYYYNGEWHMNTSGSFGLGNYSQWTSDCWRDLFWKTAEHSGLKKELLNPELTYVFELCTLDNKVVRMYANPTVYLLSTFHGAEEKPWEYTVEESKRIGSPLTEAYSFKSMKEIEAFIKEKEQTDLSYEGVVIRDRKNLRYKIKSLTYISLHNLSENGNIARIDRLVPIALSNDCDEVLTYMPELKPRLDEVKTVLETEYKSLLALWNQHKSAPDQKSFAMAVKDHKLSSLLFQMRKKPVEQQTDRDLFALWCDSSDLITDRCFSKCS